MKSGKAAGPSGIAAEMLKAAGEVLGHGYMQCNCKGREDSDGLEKELDGV
jgi:hypothetical protein